MARIPDDLRRSRRRLLLWLGLGVGAIAVVFGALSGFYIDILWFREVDFSSVFWTRFWSRLALGVVFGAAFFVLLYANLLIVRRLRPRYRVFSPEEEVVERYRAAFEPYAKWVLPGIALLFGAIAGASIAGEWESFQLWRAAGGVAFGVPDPIFGRDAAFYVLTLPFQKLVQSWILGSLITITVISAAGHYLWGGIRVRAMAERVTPQVKAHLSVLLGLIVLVKAWGYRLGQFDLLVSERGVVTGASYTDVHAHLPALRLLVVIAIFCSVLFLINIRFRGWALPVVGLGLLVVASVVAGALWPTFVQRFSVAPQELQRERPYIEDNIEFTRRAFSLDGVEVRPFPAVPAFSEEDVKAAQGTIQNIRLWNPDTLKKSLLQLQRIQPYYEFPDVDVDRYEVDGERRTVMVSPREIAQNRIPGGGATWQNRHLFYTHGYGLAASRVDQVTAEGAPLFVASEIPPTGPLATELSEPRLYIQEQTDERFTVVGTDAEEFDFPRDEEGGQSLTSYEGEAGIPAGGFFRKLAFAWRYRDVNLLISGLIDQDSRIIINNNVRERVRKIAPFLSYDHDPYFAVVDGRPTWIWDAYTTSSAFPYSEQQDFTGVPDKTYLPDSANYVRNSVKAVVDAYDGTVTLYVVDEEDPIIQAWSKVFPDLFTPGEEASPNLREHFRYPEALFIAQTEVFANYHVTDPVQFYSKGDFWSVPNVSIDPTLQAERLVPYYLLLPLPGEEEQRFELFLPFTPQDRPNMVSWMAADSDPDSYGDLVSFEFGGANVKGPSQAAVVMHADPDVARETSLLDQRGSNVIYGDLLVIPIGQSFMYVQPLYLESEQQAQSIPELKRVIVLNGDNVVMEETLGEAIASAVGAAPPEEEPAEELGGVPSEDQTAAQLYAEADAHFAAAEEALAAGDLGTFQSEFEQGVAAFREAQQIEGIAPPAEATPAPGASPAAEESPAA
ncbi:MAG: UPF0182 family protein [Actinomycetota bacterium]